MGRVRGTHGKIQERTDIHTDFWKEKSKRKRPFERPKCRWQVLTF